ncbi:hypothetical protein AAHW07_06050 [Klebsiella variicola subsp. variicola]|uniref:hypothetical protein n=1 Tax=Klebsiella variicola TaxID=244366 RepID=UPI0035B6421E
MKTILRFIIFSLAFTLTPKIALADGLLQPPSGDAAGWIKYGCTPCCYVENKNPSKRIRATLFLALGASATITVFPGGKETFSSGGQCFTGGFTIQAVFI